MNNKNILLSVSLTFIVISIIFKLNLYVLSGVLIFLYLATPNIAENIGRYVSLIASYIGKTLTYLVLTLIFFLILVPLSVLYRYNHANPLFLNLKKIKTTYISRDKTYTKEDFENPW